MSDAMSDDRPLGHITLPDGTVATLGRDLRWRSDNDLLRRWLELFYSPLDREWRSPALGPQGAYALRTAARKLGAQSEYYYPTRGELPEGHVY